MRYFIGFLVKGEAGEFHRKLMIEIFEKFNVEPLSKKIDPHITLKAPFDATDEQISEVTQIVENFCLTLQSINLKLNGFGRFDNNVLFVKVEENVWLQLVFKELNKSLSKASWLTFEKFDLSKEFHSTVISGNFEEDKFSKIFDFVSKKSVSLEMFFDGISIFKKNGKRWEMFKEFKFGCQRS